MSDEMRGACLGCGTVSMVLRFDKKGRPFLTCKTCGTKIFTPMEGAPTRWLALLVSLVSNRTWRVDYDRANGEVRAWMQRAYADRPAAATLVPVDAMEGVARG